MVEAQAQAKEINVILIGDKSVGKTQLTRIYSGKGFSDQYMATLGVDFVKVMKSTTAQQGRKSEQVRLYIWDTAGQEKNFSLAVQFFKRAQAVIICFDLTEKKSFRNVQKWVDKMNENCQENIAKVLIGCKSDLQQYIQISEQEANDLAT